MTSVIGRILGLCMKSGELLIKREREGKREAGRMVGYQVCSPVSTDE